MSNTFLIHLSCIHYLYSVNRRYIANSLELYIKGDAIIHVVKPNLSHFKKNGTQMGRALEKNEKYGQTVKVIF